MPSIQHHPKIFHITHVDNLPGIVRDGAIWSDAKLLDSGIDCHLIGIAGIKERRLTLPVQCHPNTFIGDYVPFYLCDRSIMLYILYMGNHPDLSYTGGQGPIIHLVSDLEATVEWAESNQKPWAFTDGNAAASYANFYNNLADLDKIDWAAVGNHNFSDPIIQERKQSEFLVHEYLPWHLIERIAVIDNRIEDKVQLTLREVDQLPNISVERSWYY